MKSFVYKQYCVRSLCQLLARRYEDVDWRKEAMSFQKERRSLRRWSGGTSNRFRNALVKCDRSLKPQLNAICDTLNRS